MRNLLIRRICRMSQSLSKIYLHLIFHIKTVSPEIEENDLAEVFSCIGNLVNSTGCSNVWVGGTNNHIHILFVLSRQITVSDLVEFVKRKSSRRIKELGSKYCGFSWQRGYSVFSVSQSSFLPTLNYIKNQKEHHRKRSFREEYLAFLALYKVDYNKDYLFTD